MSAKQGSSKKKRKPKTSKGIHGGGGKTRLSGLEKVLMGKGVFQSLKVIGSEERK